LGHWHRKTATTDRRKRPIVYPWGAEQDVDEAVPGASASICGSVESRPLCRELMSQADVDGALVASLLEARSFAVLLRIDLRKRLWFSKLAF